MGGVSYRDPLGDEGGGAILDAETALKRSRPEEGLEPGLCEGGQWNGYVSVRSGV